MMKLRVNILVNLPVLIFLSRVNKDVIEGLTSHQM